MAHNGQVSIEVAGMLPQTLYHMRAQVTLNDGATFTDIDHDQFTSGLPLTTGTPPTTSAITITSPGTPQPGIEMWNTVLPTGDTQLFATDLQGNVLWTYSYKGSSLDIVQGAQLLPNGDMLMVISYLSSLPPIEVAHASGTINVVREVDLASNTIRELSMDTLNQEIAAAGFHDSDSSSYQLRSFHHDVLVLPNGHWVLLASYPKTFASLPGQSGSTTILGDVLVDVDQNLKPDWIWSSFDHLDVNRHPMNFPDWTHANNMVYSADDHNLLLSIRHQNWVVKIDFNDGQDSGNVLWRLGYGGDFQLLDSNGDVDNNPADWFYAQHGLSYFSPNTTGVFRLGVMDNGNDRIFAPPTGQVFCKSGVPNPPQCYSAFPVFQINEANMTATFVSDDMPGPGDFSFFGGTRSGSLTETLRWISAHPYPARWSRNSIHPGRRSSGRPLPPAPISSVYSASAASIPASSGNHLDAKGNSTGAETNRPKITTTVRRVSCSAPCGFGGMMAHDASNRRDDGTDGVSLQRFGNVGWRRDGCGLSRPRHAPGTQRRAQVPA